MTSYGRNKQDLFPSTIAEEIRSGSEQENFKDASSFGNSAIRSCNAAVQDTSRMLHERGLRNPVRVPASGRNTSIASSTDAPARKYLLKDDKEKVIKNLEKAATMTSKKQLEESLSLAPPQETPKDVPAAPPPPPPKADTPFVPSFHWTPGKQQARRKMAPIARSPSNLRLQRANSMRSVNSTPHSSVSKPSSVKDLSYATGDELASFVADGDYLSDDGSLMSELSEQTEEQGGVIAIGIITPSKDARPAPPRRVLSIEAVTQEAISEVVATDIAQEEHDIKMKAKKSASTPGRRLSVPTLPRTKIGQSIASARQPRISLQTDLQLSSTFLSALEESSEPTPAVQLGVLRTRPSVDPSLTLQVGVDLSSDNTTHRKALVRPSLRARRSGGLSGMATTDQEEADRQVKVRAAMGAMGTATHRVVARTPLPKLSTPPPIGVQNRKTVESLEGGHSLDKRRKDEGSTSEYTVTPRRPPSLARASPSDSTTCGVQRRSSIDSTDSKDSGIDLDPGVRDSIMMRRASASAAAHARDDLSGMVATHQEEADRRVKARAAMGAMGTATHRAVARTPLPKLSTLPSIGVRNRKTVESLEGGNSIEKRREDENSTSEFTATPRRPPILTRTFSSDSTTCGVQRRSSVNSTDSMDSGIDLDPEVRDSIMMRRASASAHARNGLSGMATTDQQEADRRVKARAAMGAMGTATHRAVARTPPPMLSTPPSIGVQNRKTVESLEGGNSLDKRREDEDSTSEFTVTPRKPPSLARAFPSDSTTRGVQSRSSFDSTTSMDSGIDPDPGVRDSIIMRRASASAHARDGLSGMAATHQEEADRRVKARAAMGAMGTATHRAVARTPPPMLSTPPSIGFQNRKTVESLEGGNSLDKRREDENSTSEFTVTPRKPPSLARAFPSDSTTCGVQRRSSLDSTDSTDSMDSGIDLDPEVRDSIIMRRASASAHARNGLSGMAITDQQEADRRVKVRAAMGAMGTATHRAVARTPPPMLSTPPSIGVRNRKTVESLEGSNSSLDKRKEDEDSTSEFTVTPRKPQSLARAFSSESTRPGIQRQSSVNSTDSMNSGIDLDPEVRDSIIRRASAHARGRRRSRRMSRLSQMKMASSETSVASSNSYMSDGFSFDEADEADEDDDEEDDDPLMPFAPGDMKRRPSQGRPSDEKAEYRRNPSACLAMAPAAVVAATAIQEGSPQQSRPSDAKADYRHNPSIAVPGAHHMARERRGLLQLAPGICSRTELVRQGSPPFEPGSVTTHDMQLDEDERETGDLEAQAGVPVILPGAFAIDGSDSIQPQSGYDSGFEEDSVESGVAAIMEDSDEMPHSLDPITQSGIAAPLQAELYEHVQATGTAVLSNIVEDDSEVDKKRDKKRVRVLQGCSCFLALTIILGIVLSVLLSGNGIANGDGDSGVPTLEGWSQLGQDLLGLTDNDGSQFGYTVSLSGDGLRMAVGMPGRDDEHDKSIISVGAVMIMDFNGTDWLEIEFIKGPGGNAEAGKTLALSKDGSRLAVGAPGWEGGQVTIYEESESKIWEMVGEPLSGEDKEGGVFGSSIAFSSNASILAVGDVAIDGLDGEETDIGNVRVFEELNSTWAQRGDAMDGEMTNALFGWSLDLSSDGTRVAVSSLGTNGYSGSVRVFDFDGSSWIQNGPSIDGEADRESFGSSVSLSDDASILAVGAAGFTRGGSEVGVGRVRAFKFDGISRKWDQMGQSLEGVSRFDAFGSSVALSSSGDILAIGGPENNLLGEKGGHVQVLEFDGSEWIQIGSDLGQYDPEKSGGLYGFSVALSSDGTRVAGGAPLFNFNGFLSHVGQVLVFEVLSIDDDLMPQ
jgi:hypothetical protein